MDAESCSCLIMATELNALANIPVENDDLFNITGNTVISVLSIFRTGNWIDSSID